MAKLGASAVKDADSASEFADAALATNQAGRQLLAAAHAELMRLKAQIEREKERNVPHHLQQIPRAPESIAFEYIATDSKPASWQSVIVQNQVIRRLPHKLIKAA